MIHIPILVTATHAVLSSLGDLEDVLPQALACAFKVPGIRPKLRHAVD